NNKIQGNYITDNLTDVNGNRADGISLAGASGNLIGGTTPGNRNTISNNTDNGIFVFGSGSNTIQNNYIGTDPTGTFKESNDGNGIFLLSSSTNVIGGTVNGARNVISGNGENGILIEQSTSVDNVIKRNFIGLD